MSNKPCYDYFKLVFDKKRDYYYYLNNKKWVNLFKSTTINTTGKISASIDRYNNTLSTIANLTRDFLRAIKTNTV